MINNIYKSIKFFLGIIKAILGEDRRLGLEKLEKIKNIGKKY